MAKVIAGVEFESEVIKSDIPVLVDFYASWCGPCKMIAPVVEELSTEMSGKAKIVKIDIDEADDVAAKYNIKSVPTLMFFKNGEVVDQIVGAVPKNIMHDKMQSLL